jgi:hypothetical protein
VFLPDGSFVCFTESGLGPLNQIVPYFAGRAPIQGERTLLDVTWPGGLPKGTYAFRSALVLGGEDVLDPTNWLRFTIGDLEAR